MAHRKKESVDLVSNAFIQKICELYGDRYDDRQEDSWPPAAGKKDGQADKRFEGVDWAPGMPAAHKSLAVFQKELLEEHGIHLSTSKIRKILISGGCWTTERSREIQDLFEKWMQTDSGIYPEKVIEMISKKLGVSKVTVDINLPYINGVNRLESKSKNAIRCAKYRAKVKAGKKK